MEVRETDFHKIYEEHYSAIARYLRRVVGEADAEDVAQEAFIKVSRSLGDFRGDAKLSTWIYRIATNAAMDHLRKRGRDYSKQLSEGAGPDDETGSDDAFADENSPLPDTLLLRKDMNDCIRGIVESLPVNYRAILILSDLEGMTNAEICTILDLSMETAKIRLHRARKRLKAELEKSCHFYRDERNEVACDRKMEGPIAFRKKEG
jgi:RNA polymerase sigma-70 factor (ECF subfamily)